MTRITLHTEALPNSAGLLTRCQLVVVEGADLGRAIEVGPEPLIVGTDPSCDLVLTDERVSARHMELIEVDGRVRVRDLESRNGTLFEGSRIQEASLRPGATLKLGHSYLRLQPRLQVVEINPSQSRAFGDLVAESLAMREVFAILERVAPTDVTVLIEGETGTGKELAARAIHEASGRHRKPFVAVDCGALPETLLESELFGHRKGAFTGASADRLGAFARADGGTIFLDELSKVSLEAQARLLRVCEERKIRPLGDDKERPIDVRIVAAGSGIEKEVAGGAFRADLFYRLSVVHIELPSLRSRREDIAPIAAEILRRRGISPGEIKGPNLDRLMAHTWPGNVRELRNVLERAIALSPPSSAFEDLRIALVPQPGPDPLAVRTDLPYAEAKDLLLRNFEARYLKDVFERCDGNISAAAREAELDRKYLRSLLQRHGILD